MKSLKHLFILTIALCGSYLCNAQCVAAFTDSVTGNKVTVNATASGGTGSLYAWYIDGSLAQAANPNTSYMFQNVSAGTHHICLWLYTNNTFLCDTICKNVTVTSCGTLTAQWAASIGTNDTVRFVAYDTNSIAHHIFNFGDNTSSTSATMVTHVYPAPGTYHVCFYSYIPGSVCTDSLCQNVVVPASSHCGAASFSGYVLGDTAIRLYGTSTGVDSTFYFVYYLYNSSGTLIQSQGGHNGSFLSHGVAAGTYRACLYLYNSNQLLCDSFCNTINVITCASLNHTWSYSAITNTDSVAFTGPSNATGTVYTWIFGDGTTSSLQNVTHGFAQAGNHNVCLVVINTAAACHDTVCQTVAVGANSNCGGLSAYFNFVTPTNDTVRFTAYDTTAHAYHYWSFGDGTFSTSGLSVTHVYSGPGTYTACFHSYISGTTCNDSLCRTVVVPAANTCGVAAFSTYILNDSTIRGYSTSTGTNDSTSYVWNVYNTNGGLVQSSSTGHINNFLSHPVPSGVYRVCLDLYNAQHVLCDSVCNSVTVLRCSGLSAAWTFAASNLTDTVKFYAPTSNPTGTIYSWTLGDGTTSSLPAFQHVYAQTGVHTVCLVVSNPALSCRDTLCQSITVGNPNSCGIASFASYILNDSMIRGYSTSTGISDSSYYVWNVYDANNGLVQSSSTGHTSVFLSHGVPAGTYRICLDLYNAQQLLCDSACNTVAVLRCSSLNASYFYTVGTNDTVRFSPPTNNPTGSTYLWTFGDGTSSTSTSAIHHYTSAGTYTACLIVSNPALTCHDTLCRSIVVANANACGVGSFGTHIIGDTAIYAYSTSTGVDSNSIYNWFITNSAGTIISSHNVRNVTYILSGGLANGTYNVCMYLYNANQQFCDSVCSSVVINRCGTLTAQWGYGVSHDTVVFEAADTNSAAHHYWSFGDGSSSSTSPRVTHVYANAGVYHVCFYDYLPGTSCIDSLCESVTIAASGCGTAAFGYYLLNDTSIHAYSTSTGVSNTTTYSWTITGANGNIIQTVTGSTSYIASVHLYPGVYTVCLSLYNGSILCSSTCSTVIIPIVGACGTPSFADTVYAGIGGGSIHAYNTSTSMDSLAQISWKIWGPTGLLVQTFTGGDFTSAVLDSGTYMVCQYIRATASNRICDSICRSVVIGGGTNPCSGLSASWTHNLQSNTTDSIEFHAASNPAGVSYYWIFGDGTFGTGQNVKHGYLHSGNYTACLEVLIPGTNCVDSSCQSIVIGTTSPCPVASFSQYVYQDSIIHAFSNSTGTTANTVYAWSISNSTGLVVQTQTSVGTTASLMSHGLPNGTYNVCLYIYATSNTFCDSTCQSITIHDTIRPCSGLNAGFTTIHQNNGNVQFIPADTAAGLTHYWHFGDGTVSTNNDPVHAYATAGLYHVCQYVFYPGSSCLDSFCTNVQAGASGCNAYFSAQGYYPPHNGVHFTNLSTSSDSIIAYRWTFGDSTTASFASGNHVFPHSGKWNVCLFIYTAHGCSSTYCDSVNVSYDPCYGLSSSYTYTYTQSGGVHFAGSNNSTNITNYWSFGDGTYATTFDPIHYYNQAGVYTVCHITGIHGTLCSDTTCQSIQGTGVGTSCHANFTDSTLQNTSTVIFTNHSSSTDSIVSYVWSFGDGSSSTSANTHHTYTASGSAFYVCLTITSANGCTNTYCDSVHVGHVSTACHASFTYTVDSCQVVTFTSTSTGSLNFLRWIYGDGTTDTLSHPTHVYAQGGHYTVILHFYGNSCYNFDTVIINVPSCSTPGDTVCGVVFDDLNGNGVQNTGEAGVANAEVHVGSYVTHADSTGHYQIVVPAGSYTIYYCAPAGYTFSLPVHVQLNTNTNCTAYQNVQVTSGSNCGYNFGILTNSATICGTVYFDANNNHSQDPNESGIPNAQVIFSAGGQVVYTGYTDQYGHYCAVVPAGTYVITVGGNPYHGGVVTPGSITVTAVAGGSSDNNNFGVYVAPGGCDLSVSVIANTTVTPGYPAYYMVEVCNVGASVTSGTVNLYYDPSLRYRYSSPAVTSQNSTTFTATWDVSNLNPGSCQNYYISFIADSTVAAGQFIFTLASVTTNGCNDVNMNNNIDTLHQNATASWDPNNKQVSPVGRGLEGGISGDQWLTYTINFQNTGTAPAINIVIQDTLSNNLDLSTFKMLGASLPYTMQFAGREAIWKFNSVMLPDSGTDQQGSHGFVSFMILPVQGLPGKSRITNSADIFFDYNAGVNTNQTLNTIDYTLSVAQVVADNVTITLQPNPFNQYTAIKIDGTDGPYQLNVYDMLGRVVKAQNAEGNIFNIERGSLASGMYMYEVIQSGKVIGKGKMIAQ